MHYIFICCCRCFCKVIIHQSCCCNFLISGLCRVNPVHSGMDVMEQVEQDLMLLRLMLAFDGRRLSWPDDTVG